MRSRKRLPAVISTALIMSVMSGAAVAQSSIQWGGLESGPHGVGHRVHFEEDPARKYFPTFDDEPISAARPIQISFWYPAKRDSGDPMFFREYLDLASRALGPSGAADIDLAYESYRGGPLRPYFEGGPDDDEWSHVLATPVAARSDAAVAPGRFPLLLYAGIGGGTAHGVLFEYLASHGYVVASVPLLGTSAAWHDRGEWTARALLDMTGDLAHALREAADLDWIDIERVAVIGMSAGAQGLVLAMNSAAIDAIVAIEGTYPAALTEVPSFDPRALRIPLLDIPSAEVVRPSELFDSLRYADRFRALIAGSTHRDSYQFRRVALAGTRGEAPASEVRQRIASEHSQYESAARLTRSFLDWKVKGESEAGEVFAAPNVEVGERQVAIEHLVPLPPVPTEGELLSMVRDRRLNEVQRLVDEILEREPELELFDEASMTTVARFLQRDFGPEVAVEAFRIIATAHPESPSIYEHLGSAYARSDNPDEAARAWRRALTLLPEDEGERRAALERAIEGLDDSDVVVAEVGAPQYFAVLVEDVERAAEWYASTFGLESIGGSKAEDGSWHIENLRNEKLFVEIIRDDRAVGVERARGFRKVGFQVDDVGAVADRVARATGERPRVLDFPEFKVRIIQMRDPEGNVIQLSSPLEGH